MPKGVYTRGIIIRKPHSEETRLKMSLIATGKTKSEEHRKNLALAKKGAKYPNRKRYSKGITSINKICLFCKIPFVTNSRQPNKKFCSLSCNSKSRPEMNIANLEKRDKEKQRLVVSSRTGEKHPVWEVDRTMVMEKLRLRGTQQWKHWRESIFARDNYTCKDCNEIGGQLEPHHIIPLRLDMNKILDINNGITLCRMWHSKTIRREELFIDKYSKQILTKV